MLAHWTQNDVLVNDVRLHYYRTGQGDKSTLVLVHGFSDNGLCWTPTARDLETDYDVIMPDMRGHGLSGRVQPDENVDMAADLAGLIRTLGLRHPIVVGHSMGAMITYQIGCVFQNWRAPWSWKIHPGGYLGRSRARHPTSLLKTR